MKFKDARSIPPEDRDVELGLEGKRWPEDGQGVGPWTVDADAGCMWREVGPDKQFREKLPVLRERVLRFPSAPIHGLHRLSQEHVNMGPVESFHTYRLLSHRESKGKVSRIFLMHNGLNETRRIGLYYQLASMLVKRDKETVCLIRPFPGHLTRCADPGLSETPLDHYLWDGLHLFRQFLRYMIETRWLLSAIVRHSYYHCVSGSGLLGQSRTVRGSRLGRKTLAEMMAKEWTALFDASNDVIKDQGPLMPKTSPPLPAFEQAISSLRSALDLESRPRSNGKAFNPEADPQLHALGYSLGGFAAQSVFMSWPFLMSSCSTLLSGGAMRELAPTAFADPEEWQTVLHSLRYELDDALMDPRFTPHKKKRGEKEKVAGMDPNLFLFLKRAFYEVFQQEYRGSFQTRLVAFRERMLFAVGGNDPIVRPQSVLDSGPPDGINLISVGGLGHFLEGTAQGETEKEQRLFWLPEISGTIHSLAKTAAERHRTDLALTWLKENDELPGEKEMCRRREGAEKDRGGLSIAERLEVERDGTLPSLLFQRSLDDMLARVRSVKSGLLFILKNEPPTFLLDERALKLHAAALYHEDVSIVDHIEEVRYRRQKLKETRPRVCVVLPWNVDTVVRKIDPAMRHPSQSEGSGEQLSESRDPEAQWRNLQRLCREWTEEPHEDVVRVFDGRDGVPEEADPQVPVWKLSEAAREQLKITDARRAIKPALPDCWIWMSNDFLGLAEGEPSPPISTARQRLCEKVPDYLGPDNERAIAKRLSSDNLRMVTVSRARYNPRFRGRIIAEPRQAQELLLRAALCIAASEPFGESQLAGA